MTVDQSGGPKRPFDRLSLNVTGRAVVDPAAGSSQLFFLPLGRSHFLFSFFDSKLLFDSPDVQMFNS